MANKNTLSSLEGLRDLSIVPGAVYLGPWADIDHEKFLIVAGVAEDRILVCSVMINSEISQFDHCRVDVVLCKEPDGVDTSTFCPVKNTTENLYLRGLGLTKMRTSMERTMDDGGSPIAARIFIGGRSKNFTGQMAGLLEEFKIALSEHHPIFLIGGFGGITKMLADKIEHSRYTSADFLQKAREDAGYDAVRAYYNDQGQAIDYSFPIVTTRSS